MSGVYDKDDKNVHDTGVTVMNAANDDPEHGGAPHGAGVVDHDHPIMDPKYDTMVDVHTGIREHSGVLQACTNV